MLKSLPQAIGLPFLSTHEDSQLKFKSDNNGIKRLYNSDNIPTTDPYWSQYYTLFNSTSDALLSNPTNLSTLIVTLSHHLFTIIPDKSFPHSANTSQQNLTKEVLNCIRVLGRILVVVYENEADARERRAQGLISEDQETFAEQYLWKTLPLDPHPPQSPNKVQESQQFTIQDSDDEADDQDIELDEGARAFQATVGSPPVDKTKEPEKIKDPLTQAQVEAEKTADQGQDSQIEYLPCLVDRLFSCVVDLLFCAGFTLVDSVRSEQDDKINYVIWERGVGSTISIGSTPQLDRHKTEVLRFLLILLSSTIYTPPHLILAPVSPSSAIPNIPLNTLTHSLEKRLVLSLLCSLLNTALAKPSSLAGTLGGSLGNLGVGGNLIGKAVEERRILVRMSMMTLLVALDYRAPTKAEGRETTGEGKDENAFRFFVSKLHRKEDFMFILEGIMGILREQFQAMNNYLPGPNKSLPYILETYILIWRLIDLNKRFKQYLLASGKSLDLMVYILVTSLEFKDDPSYHGLLRLLAYLLQTISAEPAFGKNLNQTIRMSVPNKWTVAGSAADFMIVSIYSIATTSGLNPLFPALTISISNVAPYLSNIGSQASERLLQLFKAFKAPGWLLADEGHPRLVYYLLEIFNGIIYHGLNENPNLVYAILRSHNEFQSLATFTLMSGLREIQRKKTLKAAAIEKAKPDGNGRSNSPRNGENEIEKVALLAQQSENDETQMLSDQPPSLSTIGANDPLMNDPIGNLSRNPPPPSQNQTPAKTPTQSREMSEKVRGKMRATNSTASLNTLSNPSGGVENEGRAEDEEELMRMAERGVGPNGFVPTQEWVTSWQKGLPLDPVLITISELLPKIQESQVLVGAPSEKVFGILKGIELGDVLPSRPPILARKFIWSPASSIWLTSLLWGDIYVASLSSLSSLNAGSIGAWKDTQVRLFGIKQAPIKERGVSRVLKMMGVV
ncbi:hypothetical protein L204_104130 [Cryptococcus depauperatus]